MSGAAGTYTGDWKNGMPNGKGTIIFDKEYSDMGYPEKYTGDWVNGAKHGQGTATWSNGITYTGSFKNNKKDGKGKMVNPDGSVYWDGNWENDAPVSASASSATGSESSKKPSSVEMPDLLGMEVYEAVRILHGLGINVDLQSYTYNPGDSSDYHIVFKTEPYAGSTITVGGRVTIYSSPDGEVVEQ